MSMSEFDPIALHRTNARRLHAGDVVVASYPGAGATLLGNLLLELGVNYVDLYTDVIDARRCVSIAPERAEYRRRLPPRAAGPTAGRLFVKSHLGPNEFPSDIRNALLLVRDPRDSLYSYHRWRLAFSEEGEDRPFDEFMEGGVGGKATAAQEWANFYETWLGAREHGWKLNVVRFEDLKSSAVATLADVTAELDINADAAALRQAVENSTFEAMRRHEEAAIGDAHRIMRRGSPGEWHEWFTSRLAVPFADSIVIEISRRLGYKL